MTLDIVAAVDKASLDAPTPCAGWDIRALVDHLLYWGPALEGAARKELVAPGARPGVGLRERVERLVEAWSDPAAWRGVTRMGGPLELPGDLVGGMVLGELVLHGWDLGRAIGRRPEWDEAVVRQVYAEVARSADQGRAMGVYGAEVPVPPDAPTLDRALGLSGRDPAWATPTI